MIPKEQQEKRAAYGRLFHARIRQTIETHKDKPCADCGVQYHPFVMDFDHREDEEKLFNISAAVALNKNIAVITTEIAKCDVVCANCHRVRTLQRRERDALPLAQARPRASKRTHCPQGHEYTDANTRWRKRGRGVRHRECIKCVREFDRQRVQAERDANAARVRRVTLELPLTGENT